MSKRKKTIEENEISEISEATLFGFPQKIMLDGKSRSNPVLIFLHGGPGSPLPLCVGSRGLFPEITEHFTLVCWDQLGCGVNNCELDDSFRIDNFVEMTVDLIREMKRRFPKNRLYLFGASWGSVLALKAADKVPELLNGVVC